MARPVRPGDIGAVVINPKSSLISSYQRGSAPIVGEAPHVREEAQWEADDGREPQIDPTRTSNPMRPRTLKAGYIRERGAATGTLWVVFRDGTPWEYYDVPTNVWRNFKRVQSPGRFINRVLNSYEYGRGNF